MSLVRHSLRASCPWLETVCLRGSGGTGPLTVENARVPGARALRKGFPPTNYETQMPSAFTVVIAHDRLFQHRAVRELRHTSVAGRGSRVGEKKNQSRRASPTTSFASAWATGTRWYDVEKKPIQSGYFRFQPWHRWNLEKRIGICLYLNSRRISNNFLQRLWRMVE